MSKRVAMPKRFAWIFAGLLAAVSMAGLASVGCGGGEKVFGKAISVKDKTTITDILKEPEKYNGQVVRVEGKVDEVCQSMGCWFYMTEGSGRIMIDLEMRPDSYSVPKNAAGKLAVVEGKVKYDESAPVRIMGTGTTLQ